MNNDLKNFDIGTVLSISHSKLLTDIGNIYKILNYMLEDNLFTHQLPRACKFCEKFILTQHPQLTEWNNYDESVNEDNYKEMLKKAEEMFGDQLPIKKVPSGIWNFIDPIEELIQKIPHEKILILKA